MCDVFNILLRAAGAIGADDPGFGEGCFEGTWDVGETAVGVDPVGEEEERGDEDRTVGERVGGCEEGLDGCGE